MAGGSLPGQGASAAADASRAKRRQRASRLRTNQQHSVDDLSTADRKPHLCPLALVVVHVLHSNHAPCHTRAAQVVHGQHRAALVLVGQEGKAARLACRAAACRVSADLSQPG